MPDRLVEFVQRDAVPAIAALWERPARRPDIEFDKEMGEAPQNKPVNPLVFRDLRLRSSGRKLASSQPRSRRVLKWVAGVGTIEKS